MSSEPAPSATTVAELQQQLQQLAETVEAQQERIDELEAQPTVEMENNNIQTLRVGKVPLGKVVTNKPGKTDVEELVEEIAAEAATDGGDSVAHDLPEQTRARMLPLHRIYLDIKHGVDTSADVQIERAAHLFGRFIKQADQNSAAPALDASHNTYTLTADKAGDVLQQVEPETKTVSSHKTVERVFESFIDNTRPDGADESVFDHIVENGKRKLSIEKGRFNALMMNVQAAIDGEVAGPDDSGDSDEDTTDTRARQKMAELERGSR
jgi:topoisomerase IA-like protein